MTINDEILQNASNDIPVAGMQWLERNEGLFLL